MLRAPWARARGGGGRARAWLVCAAAALCALRVRLPLEGGELRAARPHAAPHELAQHLADFNNLRKLYPYIESWRIEEQWSNYTSWQYALQFSCGARCGGRAYVLAHDEYAAAAPAHGSAALRHHVLFQLDACRTLPLLSWPAFCETYDVEWTLQGAAGAAGAAGAGGAGGAGGAQVVETWRGSASAAALALRWACGASRPAPGAHLRALPTAAPRP